MITDIHPQELSDALFKDEVILIDVRESNEFSESHIPEALNLPLSSFQPKLVLQLLNYKRLVLQCSTGVRSQQAAQKLAQFNKECEIHNLVGGISAWKQQGLPLEGKQSSRYALPLTQQVHLTIGLFLVLGSALTYFVDSRFIVIPAFMGLGLTNAGITGWCGLAKLINKMPWNQSLIQASLLRLSSANTLLQALASARPS